MRVLIVSAFPPDPAPEANHALHISEQLARRGVEVHVLCKKGSIAATQSNIGVHPVIDDWTWSDLPRVVRCLRRSRPDVVLLLYIAWIYNRHPMITFLPTICETVLPGVPCVTQFENIDARLPPQSAFTRALRKAAAVWAGRAGTHALFGTLLRDSARLILLSSPHRSRLAAHDPDIEEKSTILPPPPLIRFCTDEPSAARRQARESIGAGPDDFVFMHWGYVYPGKGVETLLQAFRIAQKKNARLRLAIVGGSLDFPTGPISCKNYFEMVQRLPEQLRISERVVWTGHFEWDSDAGSRYLHAADACVLPFDYGVTLNNSSLAAASAHAVPVIATELRVGRDEALEHGQNIYLCPPQDPERLAEAMQLVAEDIDLRERLRSGIRGLARDWHSWETTTQRLLALLAAVRSERDRRDRTLPPGRVHVSVPVWRDRHLANDANGPDVSIVVAVHNVGKYLSQCLDSLVNQTLPNIEIIVVNDMSQDNSLDIIDEYRQAYPALIRVVNCDSNMGLASVRNRGMSVARGRYIGFTDGDDWVDTRMCEAMYQRAREDDADVLIGNATVFYDDSKAFGRFFDDHIRRSLRPKLRTMPFDVKTEPRIMLLEPVAWTKLYKASFLRAHALQFEDGMNSYEDICFHFSVLQKATRISLLDDPLFFYRQNRPGQISGRANRKVFEVFEVFDRIHANLKAWNASDDIWALLIKVQLRQFDWLLRDRVPARYKRAFFAKVVEQFRNVPERAFQKFVPLAIGNELAKLLCIRKNWLYGYEALARQHRPVVSVLCAAMAAGARRSLRRGPRYIYRRIRARSIALFRSLLTRSLKYTPLEQTLRAAHRTVSHPSRAHIVTSSGQELPVEVCRIHDETLLLSRPEHSGLGEAVCRMERDFYLSRAASLRRGDVVVDVGAHVGVFAIYLARRYPFITVYAIEPEPTNFDCLRRNIELNDVPNVIAINKAVAGDDQKRRLYTDAWLNAWATVDPLTASSRSLLRSAQVDALTLETLFAEYGIDRCRVLKMTAPGAIRESLKALTRKHCVDLLCGEVDFRDCSRGELEVLSWRIARQYFWRTVAHQEGRTIGSWIHQPPRRIERRDRAGSAASTTP